MHEARVRRGDAARVVEWLRDVMSIVRSEKIPPGEAIPHFFEGSAVLENVVDTMPLGHAHLSEEGREEAEAARDAFRAFLGLMDELVEAGLRPGDLSEDQRGMLRAILGSPNGQVDKIRFGLSLRGVEPLPEEGGSEDV